MQSYQRRGGDSAWSQKSEREAARAAKAAQREAKEREKRDHLETARNQVDEAERKLSGLVSLHKSCAPSIDWIASAAALRPAESITFAADDRREWRQRRVLVPAETPASPPPLRTAPSADPGANTHAELVSSWERNRALAERLLAGEEAAFMEALSELSYLEAVAQLGANIDLTVHSAKGVEIEVRCNELTVIPTSSKVLTSAGKISEKAIPRARMLEIYQDHVCSALLRVAREAFAVLPVELVLLHGHAVVHDSAKGTDSLEVIYSVFIPRDGLRELDFDRLDPSDAIESFAHRGDFKKSRKAGAFQPIKPFSFSDAPAFVSVKSAPSASVITLILQVKTLKDSLVHALEA